MAAAPPARPLPGLGNLNFVFYVVSASEMLAVEVDGAGNPLLSGQVLRQTGSFTDASLNGVSVIAFESLNLSDTPSATAGLVTTNGTGTLSLSADQNLGGTMSAPSYSGSYSTSSNGRVTLSVTGQAAPVLYLIGPNQAFVIGTSLSAVDFGVMEPQTGSKFTNSSLTRLYLGGSFPPADTSVNEYVENLHANGAGALTGASDQNGSGGPSTNSIAQTYAVSSNGRVVVSQSGAQTAIIYMISDTQFVLLPASVSDTNPALSQFQQ